MIHRLPSVICLVFLSFAAGLAQNSHPATGYTDTPFLPGGEWRVHDDARPRPRVVTPGSFPTDEQSGSAPSDAIVLFDGTDLSQWHSWQGPFGIEFYPRYDTGTIGDPMWKVENGYAEVNKTGSISTRDSFGDCQLHIEWSAPAEIKGSSQGRGNSGVFFLGRYEVQILDSHENRSYADGQAGALYGQYPPLVSANRGPGEWQSFDIIFETPRFEGDKLIKPAYVTVLHNGIVIHHRTQLLGTTAHKRAASYQPHGPEGPLMLQDHGNPIRFRNIWIRPLKGYDEK
ncbi:MAG: DUF1080 domain-containing protein [Planctomycetes bacterium]|nr:DUF1080 domain-containing protein [Planctomycetota bacterium]